MKNEKAVSLTKLRVGVILMAIISKKKTENFLGHAKRIAKQKTEQNWGCVRVCAYIFVFWVLVYV